MATNGQDQYGATTTDTTSSSSTSNSNLPKDEVGWYFVEQYYTTMSKSPEKLHLFYSKKSQFVAGQEAELSTVCVGRSDIQERIKQMDYQDCKVRVTNVDSQGSGDNIVIQVIGEVSNKSSESKKFVQCFVLASQPSGYYVLNDMLRYINDEPEEELEDTAGPDPATVETVAEPAPEPAPEPEVAATEEVPEGQKQEESTELDADVVDKKLEEATAAEETPAPAAEPVAEPAAEVEEVKEEAAPETLPDPEKAAEEIAQEEVKKPEDPKAPTPTPAAAPAPRAAPPPPAEPEKPKQPMTWASRAAAAAGPKPALPIAKTAAAPPATQPRAQASAATQQPAAAPQETESTPAPAAAKDQGSEWQTAEAKRQNRPQSISTAPAEKEGTAAYCKYVTEKVKEEDLKAVLSSFGELQYFDINRQKNCAFVEFKTQAGYNNAVKHNPHTVNGESIIVEQRRPKAGAYGGSNYNARGGAAGRGRGGFDGSRSGSQGGGRGGFTGQARGGRNGAARGRAAPQAA